MKRCKIRTGSSDSRTEPQIIRSSKRFGTATVNSNNPMKYGIVDTGGRPGGINGGVGPARDGSKRVSIYSQVEDLQATLDRAEHLGGKTILPPTEIPGGPKLAMFADPAGNITGLLMGK
jgi:uncharacterized protein